MIDRRLVVSRIGKLEDQKRVYEMYRKLCIDNGDHHGVQDASSDLRELEAQIEVLEWVLG